MSEQIEKPDAVGSDYVVNLFSGSPEEGLLARLLQHGADTLTDAELLAVVLGDSVQDQSALDRATELLNQWGGLRQLLWALDQSQVCEALGDDIYIKLAAGTELIKRGLRQSLEQGSLANRATDICYFLKSTFARTDYEVFAGFFLDTEYRLIAFEELFMGTYHEIHIYPREVIKKTLRRKAAALIFAHNRPLKYHEYDHKESLALTKPLIEGLRLINVEMMDYFVVGGWDCVSLKEKGMV